MSSHNTILVTGAQGFLGSWLAQRLLDQGDRVVVLRRDVDPDARFRTEGVEERCVVVQADLSSYDDLVRVLNEHEVDSVFHLAAQTLVGTANRSPLSTFEANVRGTYLLLEACRTQVAMGSPLSSIVVASTDKAYGAQEHLPYAADAPLLARYPYDVSKAAADMIARSYAYTYELPVAVTRLANIYGPGDVNWSRLVPETARALARGQAPRIRSDGSPERDYLFVDDAVDAYLAVAASVERPELRGRAWNVGNGAPVSVLDLVSRLAAVSGRDIDPVIEGEGVPGGEIDRQYLDSTATEQELGWRPATSLDDGLERTWRWYAEREGLQL